MIKNTDLIKEIFFKIGTNDELYELAGKNDPSFLQQEPAWCEMDRSYIYIAYIDDKPKTPVLTLRLNEKSMIKKFWLRKIIEKYNPEDFHDFLLIVTFYNPVVFNLMEDKINIFDKIPYYDGTMLDEFLTESKGMIAYRYQMEAIYQMLTGCTVQKAKEFEKALRTKMFWALAETDIIKMYDGKSLSTILEERMLDDFVYDPDYAAAMCLHECCCENM